MSRVLVTTDYPHPGDEVDALLRKHGHQVIDVLDGRQPATRSTTAEQPPVEPGGVPGAV